MLTKKTYSFFLLLVLLASTSFAQINTDIDAQSIKPILDENLRHAQVLSAPDGWYYLTGTSGDENWEQANDGIHLWKSKDLKKWESCGLIWNIEQNEYWLFKWEKGGMGLPNTARALRTKAVRGPEIHFIKGDYYLVYSMSFGGIGILKSTSHKPEGPYQSWGQLRDSGWDPSLFEDEDGKVYLVYGGGFVGLMNDDLSALAEHPRYIYPEITGKKGWGLPPVIDRVGTKGAHILKIKGKYCLVAADEHGRMGTLTHDVFISISDGDIYGPYHKRYMAVTHASHSTIFEDKDGDWWATYSGDPSDSYTMFTDKTGLVPLVLYESNNNYRLKPSSKIILENGPIGSMHPVQTMKDEFFRDPSICVGHDNHYYLVGTRGMRPQNPEHGLEVWRSPDLVNWESLGFVWQFGKDGTWHKDHTNEARDSKCTSLWAPEIAYVGGTYYIAPSFNCIISGILKSTTGLPEGPYIDPVGAPLTDGIDGYFFEDDDGSIYYVWGEGRIGKMKKDMSGFAEEPVLIETVAGELLGYEGFTLIKHNGKYMLFGSDWHGDGNGTYDLMYSVSDHVLGPYAKRKFALPHAGHATVFKGIDGKYYSTVFGSDGNAPFHQKLGIVEIEITDDFQIHVKDTKIGY